MKKPLVFVSLLPLLIFNSSIFANSLQTPPELKEEAARQQKNKDRVKRKSIFKIREEKARQNQEERYRAKEVLEKERKQSVEPQLDTSEDAQTKEGSID